MTHSPALTPLQFARKLTDDGFSAVDVADDGGLVRQFLRMAGRHDLRLSRMPVDFEAIRIAMIVIAAPVPQTRAA